MITRFEELDWQTTPIGDLMLRRRTEPAVGQEIYEVKLGDEYLMSSLFTVAEKSSRTWASPRWSATTSRSWSAGSGSATPPSRRCAMRGWHRSR